jgi:cytochrome b561
MTSNQTKASSGSDGLPARFHPALVTLHWLIAALIAAPLLVGHFVLAKLPASDPLMIHGLRAHMGVGALLGILMLARLVVRATTERPRALLESRAWQTRLATTVQLLLYGVVFAQVTTGLLLARQAGVIGTVISGQGTMPPQFTSFPIFGGHYLFSRVLIALIALHLLGLAYHSMNHRGRILKRMWWGTRSPG